ncbi:NAD-dependent epimerase/dehydratase family protein, partial [Streptomyces sp. NPDC019531]|uniref:NAD-dependent epimerase/dehydratase family protein n=1 Tax=Streptomyces sp. NPDC019531 TaxID=3365062 RepID=UPI00384B095E
MRIVVTGASGFLGRLLAGALSQKGSFGGEPISRLVLVDRVAANRMPGADDARVETVHGDLVERLGAVFAEPVDVLFHLAAAVSAECEADFDLGMRTNVDATRAVLEAARAQSAAGGPVTRLVFASSLAVYGSHPEL